MCRDDLYGAFEARAKELQCSVDWLLGEAMKRLLAHGNLVPPPSPPPKKPVVLEALALRLGDVRARIDRDRFVIGRSGRDAHLPIREGNVSRQHAMIERTPEGWVVVDMASTNGIQLNGVRVTRALIRAGDVLSVGPFAIAVERA